MRKLLLITLAAIALLDAGLWFSARAQNGGFNQNGAGGAFNQITSGTNTTAAMVIGTGASLTTSGTGTITASAVPFSGLTAGTTTSAGVYGINQAGVFTVAAQLDYHISSLNGGGTCTPGTAINPSGGSTISNSALSGCVNIPSGAGVTNGFSSAVAGYGINNNSSAAGQFGDAEVVGVYGVTVCTVSAAKCEGLVAQAADQTGHTTDVILGIENDVGVTNNSTTGYGYYTQFSGAGQPTGDTFPAVYIAAPASTGTFTSGFECATGALVSPAPCLNIGQVSAGNNSNSGLIKFNASNGSGALPAVTLNFNQDNFLGSNARAFTIGNPTTDAGYSIFLTSTAAVAQDVLVKVDTANADSVVVSGTGDFFDDGFVSGQSGDLCAIASTFCPVTSVPGSKMQPLLGTGTCTIGNYVVPDTTTAGRVKCSATQPATGWIGKALTTQSSVGSAVDVLFQPQPLNLAAPPAIGGTTPAAGSFVALKGSTYVTTTFCAANGTAANPSVVTCSAAPAGMFSCSTSASTGTCQVNTTAVTANSQILITQNQADGGASQLNVTCNTGLDLAAAAPVLKTKSAGASFTINLGTVTTNPACFEYLIVN
jgi:hypothetical protein